MPLGEGGGSGLFGYVALADKMSFNEYQNEFEMAISNYSVD